MQLVNRFSSIRAVLLVAVVALWAASAHGENVVHDDLEKEQDSLANVGKKLNDPTSDVWALFTQFSMTLSDGNYDLDGAEPAGQVIFEPILPIPLLRRGKG